MAPLLEELSPQTTERFRHNYTVSLIKMQSHRGHLGKLLFKRMAELGGVQAADQLDPGTLHHKTFMGQGEQSPHIQQRGIPHREPEAGEAVSQLGDVLRPTQRGDEPAHLLRVGVRGLVCGRGCFPARAGVEPPGVLSGVVGALRSTLVLPSLIALITAA